MDKKIKIYTTPYCIYCKMAKEFFAEKDLIYEEFDVSENVEKRKEIIEKSGQMGVPVIEIGDEIIVGFDKARINELVKQNNEPVKKPLN